MADYQIYQVKLGEIEELKNEIEAVEDAIRTMLASEAAPEHEEKGFLDRLRSKAVVLYAQYDLSNIEALLIWCLVGAANGTLSEEYAAKMPSWEASRRICKGHLIFARTQRQVVMAATMPPVPQEATVFAARLLEAEEAETAENPVVLEDSESSRTLRGDSDEQEWETVSEEDVDLTEPDSSYTMQGDSADAGSEAGHDTDRESGGDESETLLSSVEDAGEDEGTRIRTKWKIPSHKRRTCMIYNRRVGEWQRYQSGGFLESALARRKKQATHPRPPKARKSRTFSKNN